MELLESSDSGGSVFGAGISSSSSRGSRVCFATGTRTIIYRVVDDPSARETDPPVIRSSLRGKHVLITGVTGFLGAALLERLLSEFPDTRVSLLVRGRYGSPPTAR